MKRQRRVCYAGTYERDYPRNRLVIDALRRAGLRVEEAHVPVFERRRDKSGLASLALAALLLRLLLAWLRLVPEIALRLLRCDALMIGYIGQADMLLLAPVARAMGRPVIFNPLVTLTDTLVEDRAVVAPGSITSRAIATIDRISLRLADHVIVDTPQNARYITDTFGTSASKLHHLPAGADEHVFYPPPTPVGEGVLTLPPSAPTQPGLSPQPAPPASATPLDVLFYGKFIPLHGIETIIRAAALFEPRDLNIRFELIGTGQTYPHMRDLAKTLNVTSINWTDWLPEAELGARLRRADIALGIFGDTPKAGRVIPNKVYQSLASRVATITRDSDAARDLLVAGDSALLVPPDDPQALAGAIDRLCDAGLRQRIAARGHAAYRDHASSDALAIRVAQIAGTWLVRA